MSECIAEWEEIMGLRQQLKEARKSRAAIIEECVLVIMRWENDESPRSYQDLIDAIRKLKQ